MYSVTGKDQPRELGDIPQSSIGAPCPALVAGEHSLKIAYYLENPPEGWDGTTVRLLSDHEGDEPCAVVEFTMPYAHMFGPPNDEAVAGHPLAGKGLRPYGAFEIDHSSWLRTLVQMNSVHPYHRPDRFSKFKHFIFTFHDTTFECIAQSFALSVGRGSVRSVLLESEMRPNTSLERTRGK